MSYSEFLARKKSVADKPGRVVGLGDIHPSLHSWQKELVVWSVKLGRRAIGCELKPSYWRTAVDNLTRLEADLAIPTLYDEAPA